MADSRKSPRPQKRSLTTTLIVIGLLVGYTLLQPRLEQWMGVDLPSLIDDQQQLAAPNNRSNVLERSPSPQDDLPAIVPGAKVAPPTNVAPPAKVAPAPTATGSPTAAADASPPAVRTSSPTTKNDAPPSKSKEHPTPALGELREIGNKVFQFTAGLRYRPGSQQGHRIKHVLRHHEDDPDRPVHGVFDGDRNEVFAVIDEAYLYTFDHGPPRVTKEMDDGRTVYVVDLGRRIGYVGGQKGRRDGHPPANHLQLILEGTNVITAYPVNALVAAPNWFSGVRRDV